jgi:hypothetical protein
VRVGYFLITVAACGEAPKNTIKAKAEVHAGSEGKLLAMSHIGKTL